MGSLKKITKAEFITGASGVKSIPRESLPEVAFAGRSNVGKSSLINRLLGRKRLAITSSKPGRTRQINFFNINDMLFAVDLPGYGYAKVSRSERRKWGELVSSYMRNRTVLAAVVVIIDLRREPNEHDLSLMDMLDDLGIPPIVALTKADKVKRGQRAKRRAAIARALGMTPGDLILFSAVTGEGKDDLWKVVRLRVDELGGRG